MLQSVMGRHLFAQAQVYESEEDIKLQAIKFPVHPQAHWWQSGCES